MVCNNCGSNDSRLGSSGVGHNTGLVCNECDERHSYTEWDDSSVSVYKQAAADALRHAAECVDELVEKGEPMQPRQTFRRGFNAADEYVCNSGYAGEEFDKVIDNVGDVVGMALEHDICGEDAVTFYKNKADSLEA